MVRVTEEANETEKNVGDEKPAGEGDGADGNKENPANETEEKEPEDKVIVFNFSVKCFVLNRINFCSFCINVLLATKQTLLKFAWIIAVSSHWL